MLTLQCQVQRIPRPPSKLPHRLPVVGTLHIRVDMHRLVRMSVLAKGTNTIVGPRVQEAFMKAAPDPHKRSWKNR